MKRIVFLVALLMVTSIAIASPRFMVIDIVLDAKQPVAAWQFELRDNNDHMKVVGLEGGESNAFDRAPYYDQAAVESGRADRIIVASYSLAKPESLPTGQFRLATVHLMLEGGEPRFELKLITATAFDGAQIDASIKIVEHTGSQL
jgi:hypothetical protein